MFKQIILIVAGLLFCGLFPAFAQERLGTVSDVLASLPSDGCVCADYELTVSAPKNAKISYAGKIWWQDGAFRIEGDGYGIYCDKVHIWTVDSVAKEIAREEAVPIDELIPNTSGKSAGKEIEVRTTPDGKKIREISLTMKNGTSVSITVPSMSFLDSKPSDFFSYDEKSVPEGFVLTALD